MNWYDGMRYRVESTGCEWNGPWERLRDAVHRLHGMASDSYAIVDEKGIRVMLKGGGLLIPHVDYMQRRGAK